MNIRVANTNDIENIMEIYAQGRAYMESQGNIEQWGKSYPPRNLVEQDIADNKCYVAETEEDICAVFYFAIENDPAYNIIEQGQWRNDRPYGVVHRIVVGEKAHNQGIAGRCIEYAVNRCKEANIYDLRMDTHKDNVPMQRFLEKLDFRKCGIVYVDNGSERIAYHKVIIKNVVFDIGQVLLEFNWRKFIQGMNISEEKQKQLANVTLGNIQHWNHHDRGMVDEEFIKLSLQIEPDIEEELTHYLKYIGTIAREYDYSVPLMQELKRKGHGVYILSNYGVTPFKYARENMKFFDEVDGMIISNEVGVIKPEPEIYIKLFETFNLVPGECVFIDDRADNIEAAIEMGMSGIVHESIEETMKKLNTIVGQKLSLD